MNTTPDRKLNVLIIKDNPGHLLLLKKILQTHGCICSESFDGRTGLRLAMENHYDVVFVDIRVPELDGFMIATRLRESGIKVLLIAVTGVVLEGLESHARAVGYNAVLQKPVTDEMIRDVLQNDGIFQI